MEDGVGGIEIEPPSGTHPTITMPLDDVHAATTFVLIAILFVFVLFWLEVVSAYAEKQKKKRRKWPPPSKDM